jgi:hypothetical protein
MGRAAAWRADEMGQLNNSIRQGKGNVYGFLGELVFAKITGATIDNTYDWDARMPVRQSDGLILNLDGPTVDIKSKCVTSVPLPHYECSVASIGTHQRCDYYAFVRVLKDCSVAWYLGAMLKSDFLRQATYMEAGVWEDPANGWSPTIDCYNIPISALHMDDKNPASLPPFPK